jgi:hypothetical protein
VSRLREHLDAFAGASAVATFVATSPTFVGGPGLTQNSLSRSAQRRYAAAPADFTLEPPADPAEIALLARCHRFRTLADHARVVARALGLDAGADDEIRVVLERLVREGRVIDEREVARRVSERVPSGDSGAGVAITTLGFVTRDRPRAIARAVVSYASHAWKHGHPIRVVVMDDASTPLMAADMREIQVRLGTTGGMVAYAGPAEKREYALRLATMAEVPDEVVTFALLDPLGTGATYGANRNALLLETIGEGVLSADDDTLCTPFVPPGRTTRLAFAAGRPDIRYRFYSGLDTAREDIETSDEDVIANLEAVLGRSAASLVHDASGDLDLERADQALVARLLSEDGRAVAAMPGMLGDSGGAYAIHTLLRARGESHRHMVASPESFRTAVSSRTYLRATTGPALSQGGYLMATAIALDARELLPPFFPVFRCEDNLYGGLLRLCRSRDWVAHLPIALAHDPLEPRAYAGANGETPGSPLPMASVIGLATEDVALAGEGDRDRYRVIGQHLIDLARSPTMDDYLRSRRDRAVRDRVDYVRKCQEAYRASPAEWHRALDRHVDDLEQSVGERPVVANEVSSVDDVRLLLGRFGRLLIAWPALWDAARKLRLRGLAAARPPQ